MVLRRTVRKEFASSFAPYALIDRVRLGREKHGASRRGRRAWKTVAGSSILELLELLKVLELLGRLAVGYIGTCPSHCESPSEIRGQVSAACRARSGSSPPPPSS